MNSIYYVYLLIIIISLLAGIYQWKELDTPAGLICALLGISLVNELTTLVLYRLKLSAGPAHHIFSVPEAFLNTVFFLLIIRPAHLKAWIIFSAVAWVMLAGINIYFFQPLRKLNSNYLLVESFCVIAMAIYALYKILLDEHVLHLFKNNAFLLISLQLILWSITFFFWAVGYVLIRNKWQYADVLVNFNVVINILVYAGFGLVFLRYKPSRVQ